MRKKNKDKKRYSSIQLTVSFRDELKKIKDINHFDSYENTIKYMIKKGK